LKYKSTHDFKKRLTSDYKWDFKMTMSTHDNSFPDKWKKIEALIQGKNRKSLDMWLGQIHSVKIKDAEIEITVPNDFTREWIEQKYGKIIIQELSKLDGKDYKLKIISNSSDGNGANASFLHKCKSKVKQKQNSSENSLWEEKFTFANFVTGESNRLAAGVARMVASDAENTVSPVFIYGGTGLGKTHLLRAILNERRKANKAQGVIFLSAESFMNHFIENISSGNMKEFRDYYRKKCEILLIDDIQFIASKQKTQEEFFHIFNDLYHSGKTIVISSDKSPSNLEKIDETLRSRFEWGIVAGINPPEFSTRIKIIDYKARNLGIDLSEELRNKIAMSCETNIREIEGVLTKIQIQSKIYGTKEFDKLLKEALSHVTPRGVARVTHEDIIRLVAESYGLKSSDLKGRGRNQMVTLPRQIAMYLCRESLGMSFPEIANKFGGKNHSTIVSAYKKIQNLIEKDLSLLSTIEKLAENLGLKICDRNENQKSTLGRSAFKSAR